MCDKRNSTECMVTLLSGNKFPKIDKCMVWIISFINVNTRFTTLGCCCGHGKYPMTIVIQGKYGRKHGFVKELFSNITIPRKKRFYKKDSEGYYYIPEVSKDKIEYILGVEGMAQDHEGEDHAGARHISTRIGKSHC